jgi:ribosomal-protein-alanine N-acetyltransferase
MIEIVPMAEWHIKQIHEIEVECFADAWSEASFKEELANALALYFVAVDGDKVAGYAGMWHVVTEGHITNVAVTGSYRRKGIGEALMEKLETVARELEMIGLTLEVRKGNRVARSLYDKLGFKAEGVRRRYYADNGEDAIIMWKTLEVSL